MKIIESIIVLIGLLFLTAIIGFFILLTGGMHYSSFLVVVPICLFLLYVCKSFGWLTTRKRKGWFAGLVGAALIFASIAPIQYHYKMSIPTVDAEVEIYEYEPFAVDNKVITPDTEVSLKMTKPLPRLDGATAMYPLYSAFAQATYPKKTYFPYNSEVMVNKTPEAYHNLIYGNADIIFVAAPSESQRNVAKMQGHTLNMTPIGREAFVFFVNHKNSVDNLTLEQVKQIYAGEVTNWNQVGGNNEKIRAFQRPADSGSQSTLEKIMGDTTIMEAPAEDIATGMGGIIHEVSQYRNYKNAIGFTFRYYSTEMVGNEDIKLLSIDGVAPTKENIRNGTYPLTSEFYAVTAGTENPNVQVFIDWIVSSEGQALVEKVGYVPVENN